MKKAQTVLTSKAMNKEANKFSRATRETRRHVGALDLGYELERTKNDLCYINIGGMVMPTVR